MPFVSDPASGSKGRSSRSLSSSQATGRQSNSEKGSKLPKFPRIEDCAHFHYESIDFGRIKVSFLEESPDGLKINGSLSLEGFNPTFCVRITCKDNTWVVRRSLSHFETLDVWLHLCVFDRRFSHLPFLKENELKTSTLDEIQAMLQRYLSSLSKLIDVDVGGGQIFCAPVLHWFGIDNHGHNLAPHALGDVADINIPAVAAARVVRRYQACDDDELTLNVGDMVSIIEMGATGWWRGKQGLKVGSFPAQCVRRIKSATDVVGTHERPFSPPLYGAQSQLKPIAKKHGKFMDFLRSFLDTRPSKSLLKKKGILRERVFGCDLGELLHRTDEDVPAVVVDCTRYVERNGVVDGIYRISGVASHIRHLRYEFDSDRRPDLETDIIGLPKLSHVPGMAREGSLTCDPHSVAGLCKLYFRELPNPLLTYQLYNRFASAVSDYEAEERLLKVHDAIQQLPPPHYRTLRHLINHLRFMASHDQHTSMHFRNLAIVWAPNLLRSREIEAGLAAFTEARVQSVVTEFLLVNGDLLFSEKLQTMQYDAEHKPPRPRSLMVLPTPKLISLEEAQARSKSGIVTPVSSEGTSFAAETTVTGVRMRQSSESGKTSSNERRKRHHKKGASTPSAYGSNSPHPVLRSAKKQGHRHAASYSEPSRTIPKPHEAWPEESLATKLNTSVATSHGSGWKVKLGSLLKKPTQQNQVVSRQASLRRTQSDDSLVSSHSAQRKRSNTEGDLEFSRPALNHAASYEEASPSDRSHPEPQTPHPSDSSTNSPVRLRDKNNSPHHKASHTRQSRPAGGVYSEFDVKTPDDYSFHITFRKVNPRKSAKESPSTLSLPVEPVARSSSPNPFSGLDSNFPGVMGENGLDFDPLSYRPAHLYSPVKQAPKFSSGGVFEEEETNAEVGDPSDLPNVVKNDESPPAESSSTSFSNVLVAVKRVASVQSLHGESMFAAVSTLTPRSFPINEQDLGSKAHFTKSLAIHQAKPFDDTAAESVFPSYTSQGNGSGAAMLRKDHGNPFTTNECIVNKSFNNNKVAKGERDDSFINNLDMLTADCLSESAISPDATKTRRISAAEKLGLIGKKSMSSDKSTDNHTRSASDQRSVKQKSCASEKIHSPLGNINSAGFVMNENFIPSDRDSENRKHHNAVCTESSGSTSKSAPTEAGRQISVQVFNNTDQPTLTNESHHYGSFIALVGSNVNSQNVAGSKHTMSELEPVASPAERHHSGSCRPRSCSQDQDLSPNVPDKLYAYSRTQIRANAAQFVPFEERKTTQNDSYRPREKISSSDRDSVRYDGQVGLVKRAAHQSRLDTFNPEGKQREDYHGAYVSPRYEQSHSHGIHPDQSSQTPIMHNRSQSDEVQLCAERPHGTLHSEYFQSSQVSAHHYHVENSAKKRHDHAESLQSSMNHPFPAPRRHIRCYSAGDDLDPACNNVASLGHRKATSGGPTPPLPMPRYQKPMRHSTGGSSSRLGAAYENRTYEEWRIGPNTSQCNATEVNAHRQYDRKPSAQPSYRQQSFEQYESHNTYVGRRRQEDWPKYPTNSRASYAEGMTHNNGARAYTNFTYDNHQPYMQRRSAPSNFPPNEPYINMPARHGSVTSISQTSTALSWV